MAAKDRLDLSLAVALGSSIQIAIGVIPALCLTGWAIGQPLTVSRMQGELIEAFAHHATSHSCPLAPSRRSCSSLP
jgi:calcium/proton exchanger cax